MIRVYVTYDVVKSTTLNWKAYQAGVVLHRETEIDDHASGWITSALEGVVSKKRDQPRGHRFASLAALTDAIVRFNNNNNNLPEDGLGYWTYIKGEGIYRNPTGEITRNKGSRVEYAERWTLHVRLERELSLDETKAIAEGARI